MSHDEKKDVGVVKKNRYALNRCMVCTIDESRWEVKRPRFVSRGWQYETQLRRYRLFYVILNPR